MVNVIPPDYVDEVPVVEPNQHDDVPVVPEPVLVDEDEDPEEDEFKEEEDDMEINIKEDKNESELTYPYEEVDPLNPPPPAFDSEPYNEIEVENPIKHKDETVPASVHEVEKLGNTKDKVECKKLKKELEEDSVDAAIAVERARQANVKNDASGSRSVRGAVELRRWFEKTESVFEINECVEGKKVKFAAATLEGPALTWWKTKVTTMGLETVNQMPWTVMKQLMTAKFCLIEEVQRIEHELWNLKVKEYYVVAYTRRFNELALICLRTAEPARVKVDAYIRGLTDNIKGEVTSSKPVDLNEPVRMAHKLM
nr:hypothetical protein [Tanacetum cinerariifolium]